MPRTRTSRAKGTYHYAKRRDGTKYRVYHSGFRGKGATGKRTKPARRSKKSSRAGTITGFGAYRLQGRGLNPGTQIPKVKNSKGGFCIQHKEYIGDIPAAQAFVLASLPINPGQKLTFPWLSQIAENFEEWVPKGIVFMFKSTSSNAVVSTAANAALGTVVMATEYNVANPLFGSKQQMENYEGAVSCDPSKNMLHTVESAKSQNPLGVYFVRSGDVPAGSDQRFYDMGLFQIATAGMQSNGNNVGELWVSYDIELKKPRILTGQPVENNPACDHFTLSAIGVSTVDTTITPATPFGTITAAIRGGNTGSNLGGFITGGIVVAADQPGGGRVPVLDGNGNPTGAFGPSTANTYYFPEGLSSGVYMVQYNATYTTGGTAAWNPVFVFTNCEAGPNLMYQNTVSKFANTGTAAVTTTMVTQFIRVTKYYSKFSVTGTTGAFATPLSGDVFITQVPTGLE